MTELERTKWAKIYLEKLAEGIDPITDKRLPDDTILNNTHLSRCFIFVADILEKVINNDGRTRTPRIRNSKLPPLVITSEMKQRIEITNEMVGISVFTSRINRLVEEGTMRKLKATTFTSWLVQEGYLEEVIELNHSKKKPTAKGLDIGISYDYRIGIYGDYTICLYNESAQRFLLENLNSVIAIINAE